MGPVPTPNILPPPKIQNGKDGSVTTSHFATTGKLTEKVLVQKNGDQQTTRFDNKGNKSEQVVATKDVTHKTNFNSQGKVTREEEAKKDGTRVITTHQVARSGQTRSTQTIEHNAQGLAISKTVTVKQPPVLTKKSAFEGAHIVKNYDRGRFGFVYHPDHAQRASLTEFRRDSYWHNPNGMMYQHPFHYAWGWDRYDWYRSRAYYFPVYEVYPTPAYWVTDWMVGSYMADGYATGSIVSEAPSRAIVTAGPDATPISEDLKEDLRMQVENTITEEENQAEGESDKPVTSDLANALADPKHIYPVSGTLSVTMAADESQSVIVSDGDLLKLEPGQGEFTAEANENSFVTMRVKTSKGEEGEARAGALISVPLKSLQDFDSEFHARIDQGLAEAVVNKALFKTGAE